MNDTNDSYSHRYDGTDPDQPMRLGPRGHAARLMDDYRELDSMNEADVRHYCDTLPRSDYIKR